MQLWVEDELIYQARNLIQANKASASSIALASKSMVAAEGSADLAFSPEFGPLLVLIGLSPASHTQSASPQSQ